MKEEKAMSSRNAATHILRSGLLLTVILVANSAFAEPITVDCSAGQSLNRILSHLDKRTPAVIKVKGTCAEYVEVRGFDDLTLKGAIGAKLVQPVNPPANNLLSAVLLIGASRR